MAPVRLGAVDYLNARPLVCGLDTVAGDRQPSNPQSGSPQPATRGPEPGRRQPVAGSPSSRSPQPAGRSRPTEFTVRFDLPVVCARLLAEGAIDLGLVPSIAYADHSDARVVPGVGIISDGSVASVAIFTRRPITDVRTMALDTSSRTSVALTKVLCARMFGIAPSFQPHAPDLWAMLAHADAALLIGDPALFADPAAHSAEKIDLGRVWTEWTGRPFVWAFWAGRSDAVGAREVAGLRAARDAGVASSDEIANRYCDGDPDRQAVARAYLRDNIKYDLSRSAAEGLEIFYREAAAIGLIPPVKSVQYF